MEAITFIVDEELGGPEDFAVKETTWLALQSGNLKILICLASYLILNIFTAYSYYYYAYCPIGCNVSRTLESLPKIIYSGEEEVTFKQLLRPALRQ